MIELLMFILTYALISLQSFYRKMDRPAASTIGAALMLAFGVMSLEEAVRAIDYNTIMLLFGMMVLTAYLGIAGFFDWLASKIMGFSGNGKKLLLTVIFSSGFLSALFVNDTICLFMTPVVVRVALSAGISPIPLLIALATSANVGSAVTIIGNPQNMLIGLKSGIGFVHFTAKMLPVGIAGLFIVYAVIYAIYRGELGRFSSGNFEVNLNKGLAVKSLIVFALVLILFITEVYPVSLSAFLGAAIIFAIGGVKPREALEKVDWGLLLLFCNLFIVMHGFEKSYGEKILSMLNFGESFADYLYFSLLTVAGSNLVSNVPFVMMVLPATKGAAADFWLILAMASTFAGNLTLIGSVANLIVAESAEKHGVHISFFEYLKAGVPVTFTTLVVGVLLIYVSRWWL
jgi:Na+/H+ antiporter NhaD/arsenite permease-like protein